MKRARGGDGVLLGARVAWVTSRRKRHDGLSLSFFVCVVLYAMLSDCVSLRRCGDAPIPAALVSSPLPFDQSTHSFVDTHIHCTLHMQARAE